MIGEVVVVVAAAVAADAIKINLLELERLTARFLRKPCGFYFELQVVGNRHCSNQAKQITGEDK